MHLGYPELVLLLMVPGILYAAWIDYAERKVPNWLNGLILVTGLICQFTYFGWNGVGDGMLGVLVGFGVLIVPWLMYGMGAGDVKLMMAIGAWLGPMVTLWSFLLGGVIGGVVAIIMITSTGRTAHAMANFQTITHKLKRFDTAFSEYGGARSFGETSQLLPYGVPLTFGTLIVVFAMYFAGG